MQQTISILVKGKVQGVFFRRYTQEKAITLGVTGYVKNRPDGSVYIMASGNAAQLEALAVWCKKGPPKAVVTAVLITEEPYLAFSKFSIER
jgi:acylphosphatase